MLNNCTVSKTEVCINTDFTGGKVTIPVTVVSDGDHLCKEFLDFYAENHY